MKITEESLHAIDEARLKHPAIFEGVAPESDAFIEALSRWAREFPEEATAYEEAISTGAVMPMDILDHWDAIEEMAKRNPEMGIAEVARKWIAENPGVITG